MEKNILALDLGKGSLGIAISRSGMFVTPIANPRFKGGDYEAALSLLKATVKNETIEHIVIGWPLFPSGDECEMTPIVRRFIDMLAKEFPDVPVTPVDERNSTVEASSLLHESGKTSKQQKSGIDSAAAAVILSRYLKSIGQIH